MKRIRMTMAQALVKFLENQYVSLDGHEEKFIEGIYSIFGHGCCLGLGEALRPGKSLLTVYQGHNEQGMANAAIAYAKEHNRRKILPCLSSIGPGACNMLTAAATATINRLPLLLLAADAFACRQPDPVLQQLEHSHSPSISVNDAFRPLCKFFDTITRPEQIISSAMHAMRVLSSMADTGAVCLSLPQDVQGEAYDYPEDFFMKRVHEIQRVAPLPAQLSRLAQAISQSSRPLIIAGGGLRYSEAHAVFQAFIDEFSIPFAETQSGKGLVSGYHPLNLGGIGVTGTLAANTVAAKADFVLAIGTRLNDFVTASKSLFSPSVKMAALNICSLDAIKNNALPIIADARLTLETLTLGLNLRQQAGTRTNPARASYHREVAALQKTWQAEVTRLYAASNVPPAEAPEKRDGLSQTRVLGILQDSLPPEAIIVAASGSLPGDLQRLWKTRSQNTYHVEYGFSCMGYEVSGAFGAKLAHPGKEVYAFVGDGAYVLLHSELLTSLQERLKINIILFDNSGFQCIDNLQKAQGLESYACQFQYRNSASGTLTGKDIPINFAMQAAGYGCQTWQVDSEDQLALALKEAKKSEVSTLIDIKVSRKTMTAGYASWWRVGSPEISDSHAVGQAYQELQAKIPTLPDF